MEIPDIEYARSGDLSIAYQVIGEGAIDVIFVRGFAGELLSTWEQPDSCGSCATSPPSGAFS